ncbi:ATP-binding protein [Streptomyces sp. NBC_01465]|uniref:ATP-binding protein n=1 Tax=Streptomyces sp. NBC_01465 TaxID=2903878 RepID=UPI002E322E19|nr:NB-ARC domain-containing protein [Streptomyces sp. NBC_01465]
MTTSFVGRRSELVATGRALTDHRLVTLTGTGGVGKSRLALRTAEQARDGYSDGVWWADLSHLYDDRLFTAMVCDAVGLLDHSLRKPAEALCDWLADRRILLVLDCCERVIGACRTLVAELLTAAPGLTILATSREPLGVSGEFCLEVPPLSLGAEGDEAVLLFRERCATSAPDLSLDAPETAAAVSDICRRLEGIPLALELACARLHENSVADISERLTSRLDTLVDDSLWPARHRALRTAIGWSHELCTPLERLLWARLSVFRGPVHAADATSVCSGGPLTADTIPPLLERLAARSVLQRHGTRYRMLDTLREYGAMWLTELGEDRTVAGRHAAHFADMLAQAQTDWLSPQQAGWFDRISESHADLCAALDHLLAEEPETAVEMAGRTGVFWPSCAHLHESRDYLERALALDTEKGPERTQALWALGVTLIFQGDHEAALQVGEECTQAAWQDHDPGSALLAAHTVGLTHLMTGHPQMTRTVCDRALKACEEGPTTGPGYLACMVVKIFALTALGELEEAYEDASSLHRISVRYGEHWARAYADYHLAFIHLLQGRPDTAEKHARAMLASKQVLHDRLGLALGLDLLAGAIAVQGDGVEAARTSGTGDAYWRMLGDPNRGSPELGALRDDWEQRARTSAGEAAYETAYRRAVSDDAERGLAHALQGHHSP